jgi:hypothetical protein
MVEGPPGADSEEKREPVSDIDIAVADSLNALDLKRPIREADIPQPPLGANKRHWHAFLGLERNGCESFGSPPADGPSIASISASRGEIVPSKSKCCEQQGTDADWHNQKAPGHVVDDNN